MKGHLRVLLKSLLKILRKLAPGSFCSDAHARNKGGGGLRTAVALALLLVFIVITDNFRPSSPPKKLPMATHQWTIVAHPLLPHNLQAKDPPRDARCLTLQDTSRWKNEEPGNRACFSYSSQNTNNRKTHLQEKKKRGWHAGNRVKGVFADNNFMKHQRESLNRSPCVEYHCDLRFVLFFLKDQWPAIKYVHVIALKMANSYKVLSEIGSLQHAFDRDHSCMTNCPCGVALWGSFPLWNNIIVSPNAVTLPTERTRNFSEATKDYLNVHLLRSADEFWKSWCTVVFFFWEGGLRIQKLQMWKFPRAEKCCWAVFHWLCHDVGRCQWMGDADSKRHTIAPHRIILLCAKVRKPSHFERVHSQRHHLWTKCETWIKTTANTNNAANLWSFRHCFPRAMKHCTAGTS